MAATKVQSNWSSVTFTPVSGSATTFDGVTSMKIGLGGDVKTFKADANIYDVVSASLTRQPTASVVFADIALGMALVPGTVGVLIATHNDAKLASGGAIEYTITDAVFVTTESTGDHAEWGSATAEFKTVTADGTTNPVAFSRA